MNTGRIIAFLSAAFLGTLLCIFTNPPTDTFGFAFSFSAAWVICLALLILFPRGSSPRNTLTLIIGTTLLNRLAQMALYAAQRGVPRLEGFSVAGIRFGVSGAGSVLWGLLLDLGILLLLFSLLHRRGLDYRWGLLYAFHPVVLFGFTEPHLPVAGQLFFLLLTLVLYDRRHWLSMYLAAAAAALLGPPGICVLPFLVRRENMKWTGVPLLVWAVGVPIIHGADSLSPLWTNFTQLSTINSPIPMLFSKIVRIDGWIYILLILGILSFGYSRLHPRPNRLHTDDPVSGYFFVLGTYLLMSPEFSLSKMGGIIPFLALRPTASWMVLSLTACLSVIDPGQQAPVGRLIILWLPFGLLFLHDIYLAGCRFKAAPVFDVPRKVSVVIPALNEADHIQDCIQSARTDPAVGEIIVVDGGSVDDTVSLAKQSGASVVSLKPDSPAGRGGQIYAGIQAARGDVVAVVHADIRVKYPLFGKMIGVLAKQPLLVGGAAGSLFDADGLRFRILEMANDFRMVCLGISFGDQIQFFRRKPVAAKNLFPNIPLMEDVEFSIRLHRLGRQTYLFGDALVSARKWKQQGAGHALTVIRLVSAYLWQRLWRTPDTQAMYRKYYAKPTR